MTLYIENIKKYSSALIFAIFTNFDIAYLTLPLIPLHMLKWKETKVAKAKYAFLPIKLKSKKLFTTFSLN